ncbi:MAG: hypothetical protein GY711_33800 [bacterium]|nr:hypothetical protein [bacterium]
MSAKSKNDGTGKPKKPTAPRPDQMSADVLEFIQAIDDYKRLNNRPFPNWSEVLEILKNLGYEQRATS